MDCLLCVLGNLFHMRSPPSTCMHGIHRSQRARLSPPPPPSAHPHTPARTRTRAMDTFTPTIAKKRRNAKGLQLSSRSLAPPLARDPQEGEPAAIQDALSEYMAMNQATPTVASGSRPDEREEEEEEKVLTPTQATRPVEGRRKTGGIRRAPPAPNHATATADLESSLASTSISSASAPKRPRSTRPKKQSSSKSERDIRVVGEYGELRAEDFRVVGDLGAGAGGQVDKVVHLPTEKIMAKKVYLTPSPFRVVARAERCRSSSSSMRNPPCGNRSSESYRSCMAARRRSS